MGQLLVRGLDDGLIYVLNERAARYDWSVEAEHRRSFNRYCTRSRRPLRSVPSLPLLPLLPLLPEQALDLSVALRVTVHDSLHVTLAEARGS